MPRARKPAQLVDETDTSLGELDRDPEPGAVATRTGRRPRKSAAAAGTRRVAARGADGRAMSKAQQTAKARDEVTLVLELMAGAWSIKDPECAEVADEQRVALVADRITNIIARNTGLLAMVAKGGLLTDVLALVTAIKPVGEVLWKAHGPNGRGHRDQGIGVDLDAFPAYAAR